MPSGIGIDSEKQIILIFPDLDNAIQISTLKSGLKDYLLIIQSRIHPLKRSIINFIFEKAIMPHWVL